MAIFQAPISEHIWDIKYRYRKNGNIIDKTIEDTWLRTAQCIAKAEPARERKKWTQAFYDVLQDFCFLPAGRILAGAGTTHHVTLFNCFVMGRLKDSLDGIFDGLKEGALTLQQGGGVGYDFSTLRPNGFEAKNSGSVASGPVSFMRIWDSMCATIQSTGVRRGAMMGILRCDHPDIEKFIAAKADPTQLRHFNVSVLVTDAFMQAVKEDEDWELVFPISAAKAEKTKEVVYRRWSGNQKEIPCKIFQRVKARQLWDKIMKSAFQYAEPGVLFEDTINRMDNLWYREWISTTNPCGEVPLPYYGACDLGSINLTQCVVNPFTSKAKLDWKKIESTAILGARFLDNVIDVSAYPLAQQKKESLATRRIGLGFTGFADALVMLGIQYGSAESIRLIHRIMKTICYASWNTSIDLAREKKSFPLFHKESYVKGNFVQHLPADIRRNISRYGIRNSHHNSIAPTGTISILANNISSGIEPIFEKMFERKVRQSDGSMKTFSVSDYAYQLWQKLYPDQLLPSAWVDAQQLKPELHLQIQAAVQSLVDQAISKTIFIPENLPMQALQEVYLKAYEFGFKGCTVFRPNPTTGSVLSPHVHEEKGPHCCGE